MNCNIKFKVLCFSVFKWYVIKFSYVMLKCYVIKNITYYVTVFTNQKLFFKGQ